MQEIGVRAENAKLSDLGINSGTIYWNLSSEELTKIAIEKKQAILTSNGAINVSTGEFTGRSPKDKHVVISPSTEKKIWWEQNAKMEQSSFDVLYADMLNHMKGKSLFVQDLFAGAEKDHRIKIRVISELVWHNLFIRHLLIRPNKSEVADFVADFTIINLLNIS